MCLEDRTSQVVVISDLHVGSTVGLWPQEFPVEGGGVYKVSKYQQWLLNCWEDFLGVVRTFSKPPILVINGDLVQGTSPKDGQLITSRIDIQALAAEELLRPLVEHCSALYVVRGTEWHEGKASENTEQLAKALGALPHHTTGQYTRWDLYLDLQGRIIHFAHHVQGSSVPWYEATVPLRDALMQLAEQWRFYGANSPNLRMIVRSHRHRYIHVDAPPDMQVVVTPAWQLKTAFAYKKATAMLPQIGYVVIESSEWGLQVRKKIYPLAPLHVEKPIWN